MTTNDITIVRRFIEDVWNKGDLAAIAQLVSDRYVHDGPLFGELRGREALRDRIHQYRAAFPDLVCTIEDIRAIDDHVVARWIVRGTHRAPFMGIAPTNRRGEVRGISVDRVVGGTIAEHHEMFDTLALFQIIGAVPTLDRIVRTDAQRAAAPPPR